MRSKSKGKRNVHQTMMKKAFEEPSSDFMNTQGGQFNIILGGNQKNQRLGLINEREQFWNEKNEHQR